MEIAVSDFFVENKAIRNLRQRPDRVGRGL
jgi:hypothetical protein